MNHDPYREVGPAGVPLTNPQPGTYETATPSNSWVPLILLAMLVIGGLYFFFGDRVTGPSTRVDTGAVSTPAPSRN